MWRYGGGLQSDAVSGNLIHTLSTHVYHSRVCVASAVIDAHCRFQVSATLHAHAWNVRHVEVWTTQHLAYEEFKSDRQGKAPMDEWRRLCDNAILGPRK